MAEHVFKRAHIAWKPGFGQELWIGCKPVVDAKKKRLVRRCNHSACISLPLGRRIIKGLPLLEIQPVVVSIQWSEDEGGNPIRPSRARLSD